MLMQSSDNALTLTALRETIDRAVRAIPPAWPLAATVAVNPYLGQSGEGLSTVAARLARVAGTPVTMPRDWYRRRIDSGAITYGDLAAALAAQPIADVADVAALKPLLARETPAPVAIPTVADIAASATGIDWPAIVADRLGTFAAGWFDEGQALWAAPRLAGAYAAWRQVATHDLTPEIAGLKGFAQHVANAPRHAEDAIARATAALGLGNDEQETAFHRLLTTLGGWAHLARWRQWQAELGGGTDDTPRDFLAIRLVWEEALFAQYRDKLSASWTAAVERHAMPLAPTVDQQIDVVLQTAAERAAQRGLADMLAAPRAPAAQTRPEFQAAFCIDVRSEVFRRALELQHPGIRTLGFAGFFGLATAHRQFASDTVETRLPVLLNPGVHSHANGSDADDAMARYRMRAARAWGRFKLAAVSSFAFVEAAGPLYVWKLVRDALGIAPNPAPHDPAPVLDPALDYDAQLGAAEAILRAMSLTTGFAPIVLIAGHGAQTVNNPHASALHCGACGGYSGEVNARLLAGLLNDPQVRAGLATKEIFVPADTVFVAALHDTTGDAVTLYRDSQNVDLSRVERWLADAGVLARAERMLRLPHAPAQQALMQRTRDWAEVRPEWGLAGCSAFIAAPRSVTAGSNLAGRAFLHDYVWSDDAGFGVLELIITAPVVVASWISLQYYGSAVAPEVFGGGNKLLHNVVGGLGVVEGNGGILRAGLPWQSVHDGEQLAHEPLRLSVCIAAPTEAMDDILARHDGVRALFDNGWLNLFALDDSGRMAERYVGVGNWAAV